MLFRKQNIFLIVLFAFLAILAYVLVPNGLKTPPKYLKATEISSIHSITSFDNDTIRLDEYDLKFWSNLEFEIAENNFPGETADQIIKLNTLKYNFSAIYFKHSKYLYFSFIPEIKFGFLKAPPPGGWIQPIYKTPINPDLLDFLRINRFEFNFISHSKEFELEVTEFYKNTFSCATEVVPYALIIGKTFSESLPDEISVLSYCEKKSFDVGMNLIIKPESEPSLLKSPNPMGLIYFTKDSIINGVLTDWVIGSEFKAIWGKPIRIID